MQCHSSSRACRAAFMLLNTLCWGKPIGTVFRRYLHQDSLQCYLEDRLSECTITGRRYQNIQDGLFRPAHASYSVCRISRPYGSYPSIGDEISAYARIATWLTFTVVPDWTVPSYIHARGSLRYRPAWISLPNNIFTWCLVSLSSHEQCTHCQCVHTCVVRKTEVADDSVESQQLPSHVDMFGKSR